MNKPTLSPTSPERARLTAQDFLILADSGAFQDYARAELIDGEIYTVNAQYRRHAWLRRELMRRLERALTSRVDGLGVVDECSVAFDEGSIPQPDITLTTEPDGDGPVPLASVALIIEIADTTLQHDLGTKRCYYARHGVPEYWVIDANARTVHQMWRPAGDTYFERRDLPFGEPTIAATVAGLALDATELR